jgi:E3 ubiquitin-protein ligase RFWD2
MSSPPRTPVTATCPICFAPLRSPFVTRCRHTFCYDCISTHLRNRRNCPSCGETVTPDSLAPNPDAERGLLARDTGAHAPGPVALDGHGTPHLRSQTPSAQVGTPPELTPEIVQAMARPMAPPLPRRPAGPAPLPSPSSRAAKRARVEARVQATLAADTSNGSASTHMTEAVTHDALSHMRSYSTLEKGAPAVDRQAQQHIGQQLRPQPRLEERSHGQELHQQMRQQAGQYQPDPLVSSVVNERIQQDNPSLAPQHQRIDDVADVSNASSAPDTAPPCVPTTLLLNDPLAAAESMTAQQLQRIIASLSQKLHQKESSQRISSSFLLLDFLRRAREEKQASLDLLNRQVSCLTEDISSVEGQVSPQHSIAMAALGAPQPHSSAIGGFVLSDSERQVVEERRRRLLVHFDALQERYFRATEAPSRSDRQSTLACLTDDITKVTQYSQFRCRASLMHATRFPEAPGADVFRASNIVSSIEFDRESEFLATAGVTKRIKIFEFSNILRNLADVHYPVKEIQATAKLSWIVWNPYIRNHMASSDYDGTIVLWDVHRGESLREYEEHESRAWSVDFCKPNPTIFASGSDDGRVKLWSTNVPDSVLTIENHANVCSVRFNPVSVEKLAFGSAHHHVHYYDLRFPRQPLHVFQSHKKTVSYVKFASGTELVSACADSTIKLWNLETATLERTFSGHTNDRHFVGLSVNQDYIACGSEENAVYGYYKAIPKPFVQYRFASQDPLTGEDVQDDDETVFISSVCWCPRHPTMLVAANSLGAIKVLDLAEPVCESDLSDRCG